MIKVLGLTILTLFGASFVANAQGVDAELLAADRAFNEMAQTEGVAVAFGAYLAEDARMLNAGSQPILGLAAVNERMSGFPKEAKLIWDPIEAVVSESGDLGFTWGRFRSIVPLEDGTEQVSHGKYVTIWQRQADGQWKAALDIGNANPSPEE